MLDLRKQAGRCVSLDALSQLARCQDERLTIARIYLKGNVNHYNITIDAVFYVLKFLDANSSAIVIVADFFASYWVWRL